MDGQPIVQQILEEGRALEPTCAVASSAPARALKARLRKMATALQVLHLVLYCRADYVALVRCALAIGINANSVDCNGTPALCLAAGKGSACSLKALLEAGADVRLPARDGASALHFASGFGRTECVRLLLRAKAPLEAGNKRGATPLMVAACGGHTDSVELLLSAGASFRARDEHGSEPLHHASRGGDWPAVIHLLLKSGADLEARNNNGSTVLATAAAYGRIAVVRLLLELGADANTTNAFNNTPLVDAIANKHCLVVRELLPVTDLDIVNRQGRSALHICLTNGNDEIFDLLLPYVTDLDAGTLAGIDPDGSPRTCFNVTALQLGCSYGRHTMVKTLLRLGASRTRLDSANEAALSYAADGSLSCTALVLGQPGAFRMTPAEVNLASTTG